MSDQRSWILGLHAVKAALQQNRAAEVLLVDAARHDARIREVISLAEAVGVSCQKITGRKLDEQVEESHHQGVALRIRQQQVQDEPYLKALLKRLDGLPLLLILDGVKDPHNLGACMRTADGAGVNAIVIPKDRSVGLTATVRKVASGAAETVPLIQVTNLARTLKWLKAEGVWLIGTAGEAQQTLYQADLSGPLALIMGGEEKGLRRLTRENCDLLVKLPMQGSVESLNVSVAAGVSLYEALRQRQ
ncbi:MAG: 23S rRNA (guanosine(2251)-2'-O)-methyltransferase RlmB [Candidatus Thiodiazotropha lotti]|uniref:23S rRNA (guanosine-2'-O-)-methyltransferase RlmB n=1 Tax=Candidatus Thiodiazotropha lotti TaxID=2792787 RepID=A0A9E4MYH2_9GAMM|nr:23S rRNA (guanosine(2251)-2'-O)-methyltransferase RlmB [Candidatus Thiodiazotropha lotti]MCG7938462.1 23S rRNA (guanosine(2251)-2'-O)-methyltransferase RlmB [Candidatus Thiodiazotropha lotti]MCG8004302.1 23S rRNA (guanosine(2251)-2'-O)-methyltransferase RlmB [Candidatus Thiodiazotropha lotti]MCG8009337.1 23S rRNA (guanosine(2251)-2'-O)-methyltransferase RlmB [Candidatus Thiodiazotropha lotti]MCW4187922.1 23S rRNA (guanosine(2251)-2'-O)-methyltransferase RlmB [Candidatus Thiodiazotropha lotti